MSAWHANARAPMSTNRINGMVDWLNKAPPAHVSQEAANRQPLSRHWLGADLQQPALRAKHGRRETDIKECTPGTTLHYPDTGQLNVQRACVACPLSHHRRRNRHVIPLCVLSI